MPFYGSHRFLARQNGTDSKYRHGFFLKEYIAELHQMASGDDSLGSFLGSYVVNAHLNDDQTVTFTVTDPKNLRTATKNFFFFVPDYVDGIRRSRHSWEGILAGRVQFEWPSDLFMASVLDDRSRYQPGLFGTDVNVGAKVYLMFTWTEALQVDQE